MRIFIVFMIAGCADDRADTGAEALDCASLYGYDCPAAEAQDALDRLNLLRAEAGLAPTVLNEQLDATSQAHTDYMAINNEITHAEDSSKAGYTGEWVWDRMETAGYPLEAGRVWMEVVSWGLSPVDSIDG